MSRCRNCLQGVKIVLLALLNFVHRLLTRQLFVVVTIHTVGENLIKSVFCFLACVTLAAQLFRQAASKGIDNVRFSIVVFGLFAICAGREQMWGVTYWGRRYKTFSLFFIYPDYLFTYLIWLI